MSEEYWREKAASLGRQLDVAHKELHDALHDQALLNRALTAESKLGERDKDIAELRKNVGIHIATIIEQERRLRTLAIGIVGAHMALIDDDKSEAYHILYRASQELSDDPYLPWKEVYALADGAIERRDGMTFVNLPTAVESQSQK